jgi:hypothetical protein
VAELKTRKTNVSVKGFIDSIENEQRRKDSRVVLEMMKKITGEKPKMWGTSIVGFGSYHYKYASGHEGDWPLTGFSPRKQALTLYIMSGFAEYETLMKTLGKYKTGKACLYIRKLEDVDQPTLKKLIAKSVKQKARAGA